MLLMAADRTDGLAKQPPPFVFEKSLGDFAVALRQHRFAPLADADALLAVLQAECALKTGQSRPIGFV